MAVPVVVNELCADCGGCVGACPVNVCLLEHGAVRIVEGCVECNLCVHACPTGAILDGETGLPGAPGR